MTEIVARAPPRPTASVSVTTRVNPGARRRPRTASTKSRGSWSIVIAADPRLHRDYSAIRNSSQQLGERARSMTNLRLLLHRHLTKRVTQLRRQKVRIVAEPARTRRLLGN